MTFANTVAMQHILYLSVMGLLALFALAGLFMPAAFAENSRRLRPASTPCLSLDVLAYR